jgi:hypothetical protein
MKYIMLVVAALSLAACGSTIPKIVEKPILVDRPQLIVPEVRPVDQIQFDWVVINKDNINNVMKDFEDKGQVFVLFALTPTGYEALSVNTAELRRFIVQQQQVIIAYKDYYGKKVEELKQDKPEDKKPFWKIF